MSAPIVHVAQAVLGPWGLLAGIGIGAVVLARKAGKSAAADGTGADGGRFALGWVERVPGVAILGTAAAHVGEWWSDLYAEARHDWEMSRSGVATEVAEPAPAPRRPRRPRGSDGRYQAPPEEPEA